MYADHRNGSYTCRSNVSNLKSHILFSFSSCRLGPNNKASAPPLDGDSLEHPPELPPRVVSSGGGRSAAENAALRLSSNSNFEIGSSRTDIETSMLYPR